MKVFRISECDWYMAETLDEAIAVVMDDTGLPRDEVCDGERECTPEEMQRLKFRDEDGSKRTFAEELQRRIAAGDKASMFASTEY